MPTDPLRRADGSELLQHGDGPGTFGIGGIVDDRLALSDRFPYPLQHHGFNRLPVALDLFVPIQFGADAIGGHDAAVGVALRPLLRQGGLTSTRDTDQKVAFRRHQARAGVQFLRYR